MKRNPEVASAFGTILIHDNGSSKSGGWCREVSTSFAFVEPVCSALCRSVSEES